jgi:phosphohistidine phosphatase
LQLFYIFTFMKTLMLIRHAKSSWQNVGDTDFNRTLNERGIKDAAVMAQRILLEGVEIDTFITSTAVRAISTCKTFATAYNVPHKEIIALEKLYHAPPSVFLDVIESLKDKMNNVAIFAHNPGITEMASLLIRHTEVIDMPTCGIFAVKININSWQDFEGAVKQKLFFKYPKEY